LVDRGLIREEGGGEMFLYAGSRKVERRSEMQGRCGLSMRKRPRPCVKRMDLKESPKCCEIRRMVGIGTRIQMTRSDRRRLVEVAGPNGNA